MKNNELLKIIDLLKATDLESKELGVKLFKQSLFMQQFRGHLSCLGFLFPTSKGTFYLSYKDLCNRIKTTPEILTKFVYNNYKAFLIIKNNRLW